MVSVYERFCNKVRNKIIEIYFSGQNELILTARELDREIAKRKKEKEVRLK